jgi:hypothetical protein
VLCWGKALELGALSTESPALKARTLPTMRRLQAPVALLWLLAGLTIALHYPGSQDSSPVVKTHASYPRSHLPQLAAPVARTEQAGLFEGAIDDDEQLARAVEIAALGGGGSTTAVVLVAVDGRRTTDVRHPLARPTWCNCSLQDHDVRLLGGRAFRVSRFDCTAPLVVRGPCARVRACCIEADCWGGAVHSVRPQHHASAEAARPRQRSAAHSVAGGLPLRHLAGGGEGSRVRVVRTAGQPKVSDLYPLSLPGMAAPLSLSQD